MRKALLFVSVLALTACSKKDNGPTIDFGAGDGFSHRDAQNQNGGTQDATDWTSDASWNESEQLLFASLNLSLTGPQEPAGNWTGYFFPNPCAVGNSGKLCIYFTRNNLLPPTSRRVSFVVVDSHYKQLDAFDYEINTSTAISSYFSESQLRLDATKYASGGMYRIYYVLYYPGQKVFYRGHGDIKIK